jgi:hypothetical protein
VDIEPVRTYGNPFECFFDCLSKRGFEGFYDGFFYYAITAAIDGVCNGLKFRSKALDGTRALKPELLLGIEFVQEFLTFPLFCLSFRAIVTEGGEVMAEDETIWDLYQGFWIQCCQLMLTYGVGVLDNKFREEENRRRGY